MKIWNEYCEDLFSYFEYLNDERNDYDKIIPAMHVYSINSKFIQNIEEKMIFLHKSAEEITKIYLNQCNDNQKIYLLVVQKIDNPNSQVEKYFKIWNKMKKSFEIKDFILGQEIVFEDDSECFYFGIAEVPINSLELAFEIVDSNVENMTIVICKSIDINNTNSIYDIMNNVVKKGKINYFKVCINLCKNQCIVIRYGTSFEESEFALIYDPNIFDLKLLNN